MASYNRHKEKALYICIVLKRDKKISEIIVLLLYFQRYHPHTQKHLYLIQWNSLSSVWSNRVAYFAYICACMKEKKRTTFSLHIYLP